MHAAKCIRKYSACSYFWHGNMWKCGQLYVPASLFQTTFVQDAVCVSGPVRLQPVSLPTERSWLTKESVALISIHFCTVSDFFTPPSKSFRSSTCVLPVACNPGCYGRLRSTTAFVLQFIHSLSFCCCLGGLSFNCFGMRGLWQLTGACVPFLCSLIRLQVCLHYTRIRFTRNPSASTSVNTTDHGT